MGIPTQIIASEEEIRQLLPQKHPFVMVGCLYYSDEKRTASGLKITTENIFCNDGVFIEPGIIENIAQTAALRVGYYAKANNLLDPPVGYIGAIKNLKIHFLPKLNDEIFTEIVIEHEVFDVTLISGKVMCNDKLVAECEMKIFLKKN